MFTDTNIGLSRNDSYRPPRAFRLGAVQAAWTNAERERAPRNELLGALSDEDRATVLQKVERVPLKLRQVLQARNLPLNYAYFIESGAASVLSRASDCSSIEIALLGSKDFVGLPIVLGTGRSPHRYVVQVPGEALRIRADNLVQMLDEVPGLRRILMAYVQARMVQTAQLVACNTRHSVPERLARWLLVAHDRLEGNAVPMTHQCLGRAVGVRRAGITTAIGRMEEAGLLRRGRGRLVILDREGLEQASCECYRAIRSETQRVTTPRRCEHAHEPTAVGGEPALAP